MTKTPSLYSCLYRLFETSARMETAEQNSLRLSTEVVYNSGPQIMRWCLTPGYLRCNQ